MASVREYRNKDGEIVSLIMRASQGRDRDGKQLKAKVKTVSVPQGLGKREYEKFKQMEKLKFEQEVEKEKADRAEINFRDFSKEAMALKEFSGIKKSTLARYKDMLESRIIPAFGSKRVQEITVKDLNDFYMSLSKNGTNKRNKNEPLSDKTIVEHHRLISSIMEEALRHKLIEENPAKNATVPSVAAPNVNYYQQDDLLKIKAAFDTMDLKWKTIGYVLMYYGCRRGECLGLKREAIDFKNHQLTISSCVLYNNEYGVYDTEYTKNNKVRILPMTEEFEELMRKYLNWLDKEKEFWGSDWKNTPYIFTAEDGGMLNPGTLSSKLKRLEAKFKEKDPCFPHLNSHAFRHTAVSIMLSRGVDVVTVAYYVGDTTATVTKIYAHIMNDAKINAGNVMSSLVFNSKNLKNAEVSDELSVHNS